MIEMLKFQLDFRLLLESLTLFLKNTPTYHELIIPQYFMVTAYNLIGFGYVSSVEYNYHYLPHLPCSEQRLPD